MSYESYKLFHSSNPSIKNKMLEDKKKHVDFLYNHASDREDGVLINGKEFIKSPRIFDRKFVDTVHHKITVETILKDDWIECGDYLEYDDMIWLCLNSYSFHNLYCKATFMSCDWKIYWINEEGKLVSQYVIDQNSTQYNSGESGNSTVTLGAAQHMLKMQCNENTIMLDSPQRFAIDKNIKRPTCYKVTQNDNSSYNYGKGLCCVTVSETQLNPDKDKLITLDDDTQVWICNYIQPTTLPPSDETTVLNANISGNKNLKVGFPRTYTVNFTDESGNDVDWNDVDFTWNVESDFDIGKIVNNNTIKLSIDNEKLIGSSFLLQILVNNSTVADITVTIVDKF